MDVFLMQRAVRHRQNSWRYMQRLRLNDYTDEQCQKKLRLPKANVEDIVNTLRNDLKPLTNKNNPIHPDTQVMTSLRLLASGSFQVNDISYNKIKN